MSGTFTSGGLITGMDTNTLIRQLMALERQPITRIETRITNLQTQQTALRSFRTQLTTLRGRAQDFKLLEAFDQYTAQSSSTSVLTASAVSGSAALGAHTVNATQLASATSATSGSAIGGAINPASALLTAGFSTAVTAGSFSVNGKTINVDPSAQSLNDIITAINGSGAGVTATYDAGADRVTIANTAPANTSIINFMTPTTGGTNFLTSIGMTSATQSTNGAGSTEATSTTNLGSVNPGIAMQSVSFGGGAVTAGAFSINGVSIAVDPATDSLQTVLSRINSTKEAGVTASYDAASDSVRVVSNTLGSRTIGFGDAGDTSNFLSVTNLTTATQTAGKDAQFTINGGPVITRNSNQISDAIGGVTFNLLSQGTSTITVAGDDGGAIERVRGLVSDVNTIMRQIATLTGESGVMRGDSSLRMIESQVKSFMMGIVGGASGSYNNMTAIGISTGSVFDAKAVTQYEVDATKLQAALTADRDGVASLFVNSAGNGVAESLDTYLNAATKTDGFLNQRAGVNGTIASSITSYNDRITRMEERLAMRETRLRKQFALMEELASGYQQQSTALNSFSSFGS